MTLPRKTAAGRPALMVAVLLLAFFIPKVNLAGDLKIDDAVFFLLIVVSFLLTRKFPVSALPLIALFFVFIFLNLSSYLIYNSTSLDPLLFLGRYVAYFMAFLVGLNAVLMYDIRIRSLSVMTSAAIWFTLCVAILQSTGLIGGWIDDQWRPTVSDRIPGVSAHPTEFGLLMLVLMFLLGSSYRSRPLDMLFAIQVAAIAFSVFLSGSRTSMLLIVIYAIVIAAKHPQSSRLFIRATALGVFLLLPVLAWLTIEYTRFNDLVSVENARGIVEIVHSKAPDTFADIDPGERPSGMDASLYIRLSKWMVVFQDVRAYPLGGGPGTYGVATDGLYVRVLGESGFLGLLTLIIMLAYPFYVFKGNTNARLFIFVVVINSITIDTIFFSRFGYLFWFLIGCELATWQKMIIERRMIKRHADLFPTA